MNRAAAINLLENTEVTKIRCILKPRSKSRIAAGKNRFVTNQIPTGQPQTSPPLTHGIRSPELIV